MPDTHVEDVCMAERQAYRLCQLGDGYSIPCGLLTVRQNDQQLNSCTMLLLAAEDVRNLRNTIVASMHWKHQLCIHTLTSLPAHNGSAAYYA